VYNLYWYCGRSIESQTIELAIDDPGLLYGASVFTTLRSDALEVYDRHYDRLQSSLLDLGWHQPDRDRVRSGVEHLAPHFPVLRITIFPDGCELITGRELPPNLATWQKQGVTAIIADRKYTRSLPQHKTGNYLAPWLALQQARTRNIQEAILTNDRGDWLETTTGNLWGYRDGCWYTPPLSAGILPGIERSRIINYLHQQDRSIVEVEWKAEWVKDLESIGYSNSVIHLLPIHTVLIPMGKLEYTPHHLAIGWPIETEL
jgi:4-amino-4-deoxychorismate lyase